MRRTPHAHRLVVLALVGTALACKTKDTSSARDTTAVAPTSQSAPSATAPVSNGPQKGSPLGVLHIARRSSADTIVCHDSARYATTQGVRYLHVHAQVARSAGGDMTTAETVISTDAAGTKYTTADTASIDVDGEGPWTLTKATGVSSGLRKSGVQAHSIVGSAGGPTMGPVTIAACGG
jgi:hypothetical protein